MKKVLSLLLAVVVSMAFLVTPVFADAPTVTAQASYTESTDTLTITGTASTTQIAIYLFMGSNVLTDPAYSTFVDVNTNGSYSYTYPTNFAATLSGNYTVEVDANQGGVKSAAFATCSTTSILPQMKASASYTASTDTLTISGTASTAQIAIYLFTGSNVLTDPAYSSFVDVNTKGSYSYTYPTNFAATLSGDYTVEVDANQGGVKLATFATFSTASAPTGGGSGSGGSGSGGSGSGSGGGGGGTTGGGSTTTITGTTTTTGSDGAQSTTTTAQITASQTDTSAVANVNVNLGNVTVTAPSSVLSSVLGSDTTSTLQLSQTTAASATQIQIETESATNGVTPIADLDVDLTKVSSSGTTEAIHNLSGDVTLTIQLTDAQIAQIPDVALAQILYFNPVTNTFTDMGAKFDLTAKTVTFNTNHFSTYVIATIDKTVPVVCGVENNGIYNLDKTITFDNGTALLDGTSFTSGTTVSKEGKHTLVVTDLVGNSTTVVFTIDKTAPTITGVANNGIYSVNQTVTFNEGTATLDGVAFTTGTKVSSEGKHILVVTDLAGNKTTESFVIDKSTPVITAKTSKKVVVKNGGYSATSVTVSASDLFSVTKSVTLNGKAYGWPSNSTFSKDGVFVVTVKDQYDYVSKATFTIDETAPKITVKSVSGGKTVTIAEANLSTKTATLNGKAISWPSGNKFTKKGAYVITVTDKSGNKTTSKFSI